MSASETMYTLDLSGHAPNGKAAVNRFGGLFSTVEAAVACGKQEATPGRLHFTPEILWVRDEESAVVCRQRLSERRADHG